MDLLVKTIIIPTKIILNNKCLPRNLKPVTENIFKGILRFLRLKFSRPHKTQNPQNFSAPKILGYMV